MVPRVQEELTPKIYQLIQYVNESNTALAKKVRTKNRFSHSTMLRLANDQNKKLWISNLLVDHFQGTDKKSAEQKAQIAKAKVVKDTKSIPTLVFKIETFEKNLIKLSQKTKNKKLLGNTKLSVARDCRIRLENIVNNGDENETENRGNSI